MMRILLVGMLGLTQGGCATLGGLATAEVVGTAAQGVGGFLGGFFAPRQDPAAVNINVGSGARVGPIRVNIRKAQ